MRKSWLLYAFILAAFSCAPDRAGDGEAAAADPEDASASARSAYSVLLVAPDGFVLHRAGSRAGVTRFNSAGNLDSETRQLVLEAAGQVDAVVVAPAVKGTASLFAQLKAAGSKAVLAAVWPEEEPLALEAAADLVVDIDLPLGVWGSFRAAQSAGAESAYLFGKEAEPSYRSDYRQALSSMAAALTGIEFAQGPLGDGAGQPEDWGKTVLFPAGSAWSAEAFREALGKRAIYAETVAPASAYSGAAWNPKTYIDDAVATAGSALTAGRLLIWPWHRPEALASALIAHLERAAIGSASLRQPEDLAASLKDLFPAGAWQAYRRQDPETGVLAANHLLVAADPYMPGRGYAPALRSGMPQEMRLVGGD